LGRVTRFLPAPHPGRDRPHGYGLPPVIVAPTTAKT
jgi:hypothetical protein